MRAVKKKEEQKYGISISVRTPASQAERWEKNIISVLTPSTYRNPDIAEYAYNSIKILKFSFIFDILS